jgi:bifunctional non-homologous end joining protein LigD
MARDVRFIVEQVLNNNVLERMPASQQKRDNPGFVIPMAALAVEALPEGPEWSYELKLDGYRALIIKDGESIKLRSRNDKDLLSMYPALAMTARRLQAEQAVIDGEIVAVDAQGRPSFQALQHRGRHPQHSLVFYAFDLLFLNGEDTTPLPLKVRKAKLENVVKGSGLPLSIALPGSVSDMLATVRAMQLEGIVAKRNDSIYEPGERSRNWQKLKLERRQEFVVGGYRLAASDSVDALLVGYYEDGELRFAARTRAGLVPHIRQQLARSLKALRIDRCPFVDLPTEGSSRWGGGVSAEDMKEMNWTKPEIVVEIQFVEWTGENRLRLSKYLGLRPDKQAEDVRRET